MIFNRTQGKDIPPQAIKKSLATRALFIAYLELLTVASRRMAFFSPPDYVVRQESKSHEGQKEIQRAWRIVGLQAHH